MIFYWTLPYSNQIYLDKIDMILGSKNSIKKIYVVQKHI